MGNDVVGLPPPKDLPQASFRIWNHESGSGTDSGPSPRHLRSVRRQLAHRDEASDASETAMSTSGSGDEAGPGETSPSRAYIRYIEPTEEQLAEQVEYDMDLQDLYWLKEKNKKRRQEGLPEVTLDQFEATVDSLEKCWFDAVKNLPKPIVEASNEAAEDSRCCICDDGECSNSNAIVFCDGCNLAVHQDCYGVPFIPEGQWLCRKCLVSPEHPVTCLLCPNPGGAFKQTNTNAWAHLICAMWIAEVTIANSVYLEPIEGIDMIPKARWRLVCYICREKVGACIQCSTKTCFTAFHVTCAKKANLYMKIRHHSPYFDGVDGFAYCSRHTPKDHQIPEDEVDEYRDTEAESDSLSGAAREFKGDDNDIDDDGDDGDEARVQRTLKRKRGRKRSARELEQDMQVEPVTMV